MAQKKDKKETKVRLDRFLANAGIGTRTEVKNYISKGQITVNGTVLKDSAYKVDTENDTVFWKNECIQGAKDRYYLFHKPAGCVSAVSDERDKTVLDYFPKELRKDLFPVGRLDKDTEGLLLLTTDGQLSHTLTSPAHHVDKCYFVVADGDIGETTVASFKEGVDIGDEKPTKPAELILVKNDAPSMSFLTISEGRYHQVKRMFEKSGAKVTYLKRVSFGPIILDDSLRKGEFRELTAEEVEALRNASRKKEV